MNKFGMVFRQVGAVDIAADADDPNTAGVLLTDPRVFRQGLRTRKLNLHVLDGTSLVCSVWIYDESATSKWWLLGKATVASATGAAALDPVRGASTYIQYGTNTGNVQNFAVSEG